MRKINSSAMYYALFLSVIFALLLGGMVLFAGFNQNLITRFDTQEIIIDNAKSGIEYAQSNFKELKHNDPLVFRLFNEGVDSVSVEKKQWGAFTIVQSTARHRNYEHTKIALLGNKSVKKYPNLFLTDQGRPISLCGDARLEGQCSLPKAGLKRAYIEGKNYTGAKMIYGQVTNSEKLLPKINQQLLNSIDLSQGEIHLWNERTSDSIVKSFQKNGIHFVQDGILNLQDACIKGQIMIEAKDSIFIGASSTIENAIVKSKVIYIESGFSGSIQAFASERIILEENVRLRYPSVLGIVEKTNPTNQSATIVLGEKSQVIGSVFLLTTASNFRLQPQLSIATDAEIDGFAYCQGKTELKGTIKGHLFTEKFYLKTAASSYENHILDGQLLDQLPTNFVSVNLLEDTDQLTRIEWLQ